MGLRYNRNRARQRFFPLFSPRELFYGGIPGAWYDPTDLSTMFQDSTGTTPVTAVEQPVGRILDKSGNANHATQAVNASRPTYRARYNLLTYSEDFGNAAWVKLNASASTNVTTAPDGTVTADALIEDAANTFHIVSRGAGSVSAAGIATFSCYLKASTRTSAVLQINEGANRYAALFDLTNGVVAATNTAGTPTSTSNSIVAVGSGWYRCIVSCAVATTCDAIVALSNSLTPTWTSSVPTYLGNGTSGVFLWGAQLLTAADVTATGNAYQRIAAATVYDTAAIFRPYLAFDGVDDSLSTSAINFTSTDKMTVFAGVTKSSGAALGMVTELGNRNLVQAGSFSLSTTKTTS